MKLHVCIEKSKAFNTDVRFETETQEFQKSFLLKLFSWTQEIDQFVSEN